MFEENVGRINVCASINQKKKKNNSNNNSTLKFYTLFLFCCIYFFDLFCFCKRKLNQDSKKTKPRKKGGLVCLGFFACGCCCCFQKWVGLGCYFEKDSRTAATTTTTVTLIITVKIEL